MKSRKDVAGGTSAKSTAIVTGVGLDLARAERVEELEEHRRSRGSRLEGQVWFVPWPPVMVPPVSVHSRSCPAPGARRRGQAGRRGRDREGRLDRRRGEGAGLRRCVWTGALLLVGIRVEPGRDDRGVARRACRPPTACRRRRPSPKRRSRSIRGRSSPRARGACSCPGSASPSRPRPTATGPPRPRRRKPCAGPVVGDRQRVGHGTPTSVGSGASVWAISRSELAMHDRGESVGAAPAKGVVGDLAARERRRRSRRLVRGTAEEVRSGSIASGSPTSPG